MADATAISFVPIVGYDNLVLERDSDDGIYKPYVRIGAGAAYVPRMTDFSTSQISSFGVQQTPEGRPGSLKTVLQLIPNDDAASLGFGPSVNIGTKIPPGLLGQPLQGIAAADQVNTPIDGSKFLPTVTVEPLWSPFGQSNNVQIDRRFRGGVLTYISSNQLATQGDPPTYQNIGQHGINISIAFNLSETSTDLQPGDNWQVTIDYSASVAQ